MLRYQCSCTDSQYNARCFAAARLLELCFSTRLLGCVDTAVDGKGATLPLLYGGLHGETQIVMKWQMSTYKTQGPSYRLNRNGPRNPYMRH